MEMPTAGILVQDKLDETAKEKVLAFIHSISTEVGAKSFRVNGCLLGYELGPGYPEEMEEYSGSSTFIGWTPKDIIGLRVVSNDDKDHAVLDEVTAGIADAVNGIITFCHTLKKHIAVKEAVGQTAIAC